MRVDSKQVTPLSIERLCDWAERAQPTSKSTGIILHLFKGDGYNMALIGHNNKPQRA